MHRRALWPVLLAAAIGLSILLSLGIWQVQRLGEKQAQISALEQRLKAEPIGLAAALANVDVEAIKVAVSGRFLATPALRKIAVLRGGPGFDVLQPFITEEGVNLLVQRGIAGEGQAIEAPQGDITLIGLLRLHNQAQGRFDPDNNPVQNQWNWWDITAMYQAAGLKAPPQSGLLLQLLPKSSGTETLFVDPPKATLRNNHLGYAITWFGLAVVLVVMTVAFMWRLRKDQKLA